MTQATERLSRGLTFSTAHRSCPETRSWLPSLLKRVFYIRSAHPVASRWDDTFPFLLKRKYQVFIAQKEKVAELPASKVPVPYTAFSTTCTGRGAGPCAGQVGRLRLFSRPPGVISPREATGRCTQCGRSRLQVRALLTATPSCAWASQSTAPHAVTHGFPL